MTTAPVATKPNSGNNSFSSDESPETSHPRQKQSPRETVDKKVP